MERIRQLIATNRLPEALQALYEALPAHLKNDALALQNQLQDLERNERLGMIGFSEASIRRANITNGALALTNQIGAPAPQHTPNPVPPPAQPTPAPPPAEPTKILFLAANPVDKERLQTKNTVCSWRSCNAAAPGINSSFCCRRLAPRPPNCCAP